MGTSPNSWVDVEEEERRLEKLLMYESQLDFGEKNCSTVLREKRMKASVKRPPTPDPEFVRDRERTLKEIVNIRLTESGEKERLQELLRERLIECGWKDEMKALCREFARKKGRNNVTVDELVAVITPKGRASVPIQ